MSYNSINASGTYHRLSNCGEKIKTLYGKIILPCDKFDIFSVYKKKRKKNLFFAPHNFQCTHIQCAHFILFFIAGIFINRIF